MAVTVVDTKVKPSSLSALVEWLHGVGQGTLANKVAQADTVSEAARLTVNTGFSATAVARLLGVDVRYVEQAVTTTGETELDRVEALAAAARNAPISVRGRTQAANRILSAPTLEEAARQAANVLNPTQISTLSGLSPLKVAAVTGATTGFTSRSTPSGSAQPGSMSGLDPGVVDMITGGGMPSLRTDLLPGQTPEDRTTTGTTTPPPGGPADQTRVQQGGYPGAGNSVVYSSGAGPAGSQAVDPTVGATALVDVNGQPIMGMEGNPYYEAADGSRFTIGLDGEPRMLDSYEVSFIDSQLPVLPPYIGGFAENYRPEVEASNRRKYGARDVGPPRYREFDQDAMFAGMSVEYMATVQGALVRAGLMDEDDVRDVWAPAASNAMSTAMLIANASGGKTWIEILRDLEQSAPSDADKMASARAANPFIAPVYRAPDPASLKQGVRAEFSRQLGRDVEDWEFGLFLENLSGDFKAQHAAEISAARSQYDAGIRASVTGESGGGGTVQQVDPFARMSERFLTLYNPEIEAETAEDERQLNTSNLARNLAGLEQTIGGMI